MLASVLLVIAIGTSSQLTMIVAVIASGSLLGINNTLVTTVVVTVAPVPRPVASAAYGFVRIIGGGLAPFAAGKLAEHYNVHRLRSELQPQPQPRQRTRSWQPSTDPVWPSRSSPLPPASPPSWAARWT